MSQYSNMKQLSTYVQERLIINKDYREVKIVVKSFDELRKIIEDRYKKLGSGTKQNPIDFNDIDVSNLDSFYDKNAGRFGKGLFENIQFKYIDISYWDVSNIESMKQMFYLCKELKSVGDISKWNVSKVTNMVYMFYECNELEFIGDISKWDVSNVIYMTRMFEGFKKFNQDISNWNISNVRSIMYMFDDCPIKDEYKPKFK